jgi:phosphatidylserine/phosphatidylglycerophosphate/cardiolipin synthase-like enzyme
MTDSGHSARDNAAVDALGAADQLLGRAIERALEAHHRYRLRRLGRLEALNPPDDGSPWCREAPPPRDGCSIEVLIDGEAVLPAIAEAIRGARRSVRIAGWHSAPHFALERTEPPTVLRELLAETAARGVEVRVLLWAGAPLRVFTPARRDVRADADELTRGTGVRVALDNRERLLHCHHEKLVVLDDEVAFVGGVDLTDLGGDRWDTPQHPARGRLGWHDAGTRLRGPIVADVAEHLDLRWTAVTGEQLPAVTVPARAGETTIQLLRTIPEHVYDRMHNGAFGILEGYMRALHSARELVYLESQFFWLPEIVDLLSAKLRDPPSDRFRIVVLLPSKANNGQEDTRGMLAHLVDADGGRGRFLATTIDAMTGSTIDRLYVHAKIGVVDDRWLTIGSANLNAHSFFNDTEVNVQVADETLARAIRLRLWSEHLGVPEAEVAGDPADIVDRLWIPIAHRERERHRTGQRREHRLRELTPGSRKLEQLLGPMDAIVVDA